MFKQTIEIPMGKSFPIWANLSLYSYLLRFIDDASQLNTPISKNNIHLIHEKEKEIKEATDTHYTTSYLDINLYIDVTGHVNIYSKLLIVNFLFLIDNLP